MDVISGIASVSQLGAYGQSAARCLQRLYLRVHEGPSLYQREKTNISALLDVIKRVCKQESVATENVLALLVDISSLASDILSLLQRHGFLGINWTLVICPQSLSDAFQALTAKRELLHLSIAQSNHELSIDIQKNFEEMNQTMSNQHKKRATTEHTGSGPSDAANEQSVRERHGLWTSLTLIRLTSVAPKMTTADNQ